MRALHKLPLGFEICTILLVKITLGSWSNAESTAYNCVRHESAKCTIPSIIVTNPEDEIILPNLSNKTILQIKSGNLSSFTETISDQLKNIEILHLGNMGLKDLFIHPHLIELSAENNEIALINMHSKEDYKAKVLKLANNRLSSLGGFERLVNLVELNLGKNLLEQIDLKTFAQMNSLKILILVENQLTTIEATEQVSLPGLDFLSLARNKLVKLNVSHWDFESLTKLDISSNQLIHIDSIDDHFPSLSDVFLAGNSWHCMWLEELLKNFTTNFVTLKDSDKECVGMSPSNICCLAPHDTSSSYDESFQRLELLETKQSELQQTLQIKIQNFENNQSKKLNDIKSRLDELLTKQATMVSISGSDSMDKDGFSLLKGKVANLMETVDEEVAKFEKRNKENSDAQRKLGFAIVDLKRFLMVETNKMQALQAQFALLKEYALKTLSTKNGL